MHASYKIKFYSYRYQNELDFWKQFKISFLYWFDDYIFSQTTSKFRFIHFQLFIFSDNDKKTCRFLYFASSYDDESDYHPHAHSTNWKYLKNVSKVIHKSVYIFTAWNKVQSKFIPRTFSTAFAMEKAHKNSESATKCIKLKREGEF